MIISKKHKENSNDGVTLYLGGITLGEVESFKYLGILLHKHLMWSEHISGICSKAKQILGLIYRQFYNNSSSATLSTCTLSVLAVVCIGSVLALYWLSYVYWLLYVLLAEVVRPSGYYV